VNFPAQVRAAVDNVKSYTSGGNLPSLPEFEEFLREAGFSKTQATAIAGKGLAPLLRGEPGNDQAAFAAKLSERLRVLRSHPEGKFNMAEETKTVDQLVD
jgi:hypothetical protein